MTYTMIKFRVPWHINLIYSIYSEHHAAEGAYSTVVGGYSVEYSNDYSALTAHHVT